MNTKTNIRRFSDRADYIYLATEEFNLDTIFTDDIIAKHTNVLTVFSNEENGNFYHLHFEISTINIVLRTMLLEDQRTEYGSGFRMVLYPTGTYIAQLQTQLNSDSSVFMKVSTDH